jgi:hypothetical protein
MNEIMPFAGKWIRPIYHVKWNKLVPHMLSLIYGI